MRFSYTRRGFTLVELLVAVGIVGVLSAVVFTTVSEAREKARDIERVNDIAQLEIALKLYNDAHGTYVVAGGGSGGTGWVSCPYGNKSVAQVLYEKGYLPTPDIRDPSATRADGCEGYMIYVCDGGRRYSLSATKENPVPSEITHAESLCNGTGANGIVTQYGKNYGVGN